VSLDAVNETRCPVCKAWLDEEDLFCHNCGTEAPECHRSEKPAATYDRTPAAVAFHCSGCGASMNYDATAKSLRCPFCGNRELQQQSDHRILKADAVVPFRVNRDGASRQLRAFLGSSFWHPNDLRSVATLETMTPLYIPYWSYAVEVETFYTVDSSQTPFGSRGSWIPLSGQHNARYPSILVPASRVLSSSEMNAIEPFDIEHAVPPEEVDLTAVTYEEFQVQRRESREFAKGAIEHHERNAIGAEVPGRARNLQVNVLMTGIAGRPVLLPVWILAYRYRGSVFRVLINGQTGRTSGTAPTSVWKSLMVMVAFVLALLVLLTLLHSA
jgi:predicted RNA-binding Zn-ribbon protein involved in translation (DUF1610 family)